MNLEKVKKCYNGIWDLVKKNGGIEFEVAFLIFERLDNNLSGADDITQELVDKVEEICNSYDTLIDYETREDLEVIDRALENGEDLTKINLYDDEDFEDDM